MPNTRNFKSPGIWGLDAETAIPLTPTEGVAYRNTALTQAQTEEGEKYNTKPDSANFNQVMFTITSFLDDMDSHGVIGWYSQVDYLEVGPGIMGSITRGSDGNFYTALLESGPGTVAGAIDPTDLIDGPTYWARIFGSSGFELDLTSQTPGDEGARLVGTSYQPDVIDFPDPIEQPVQTSLETVNKQSYYLRGLVLMLSGKFDVTGALVGNAFNILNNEAEWVQQNGYSYFRIFPAGGSPVFEDIFTMDLYVTPEREVAGTNVLTANTFIVLGPWFAGPQEIDATNSIKILFTDPFNVASHLQVPFSITGLMTSIVNGKVI